MTMSDQNVGDRLPLQRPLQGFEMLSIFRAGINDSHFAMTDDVDAGANIGERPGIVRDYAANERGNLLYDAVFELDFANVGNSHIILVSCSDPGLPERSALLRSKGDGKGLRHATCGPQLGAELQRHGRAHIRLVCIDDVDSSG